MALAPERRTIPSHARIRPIRKSDVEAIVQILQDSPEAAIWSRAAVEELIGQRGVLAFVFEEHSLVSGFLAARQIADEAEILNVAIVPGSRRAGQGSALLRAAFDELRHRDVNRIFLEVRASNAAAITFYRKYGFVPTGRRPVYYQDPVEDAICMQANLTT